MFDFETKYNITDVEKLKAIAGLSKPKVEALLKKLQDRTAGIAPAPHGIQVILNVALSLRF